MMCRLRMGCENRNGEMSANKWVTNNKAINQQGWRLQKGITMRSLLLLFCCCCVCAFTICHSTIYNNYSLECLSSFVAAVCGHCFSCQFISHCCAVCLPAPHKRHTHTPFFLCLSIVFLSIRNRFRGPRVFQCLAVFAHQHTHDHCSSKSDKMHSSNRWVCKIMLKQWTTRTAAHWSGHTLKPKQLAR